jgi:sensor c-di-GMP phosphodiesterase-like protein
MKFSSTARRLLPEVGLLLCGIALGVVLADSIAHVIRLQEGRAELMDYAQRLVTAGDLLGEEDSQAIVAVSNDHLPFCSDQEIEFLRNYVFHSAHIRDLGHTKDGMLYCSAGVGRLAVPAPALAPDI